MHPFTDLVEFREAILCSFQCIQYGMDKGKSDELLN